VLRFGGVPFEIEPRGALSRAELEWIERVEAESPGQGPEGALEPCRLRIVSERPYSPRPGPPTSPLAPAEFEYEGDLVRLGREDFAAEIDPTRRECRFFRAAGGGLTIQIALKTTMACVLPLSGGVVLHSAAVDAHGEGLAFFGPSGAGKSTLSALSPFPVLSDELVALSPGPVFSVQASGFWGTLDRADAPRGAVPLRAVFALEKGPRFLAGHLSASDAVRRLLGSTLVPSSPPLWRAALSALGELVRSVPVFRMEWTPDEPPWERILALLAEVR
jgi:hypothetical protein